MLSFFSFQLHISFFLAHMRSVVSFSKTSINSLMHVSQTSINGSEAQATTFKELGNYLKT